MQKSVTYSELLADSLWNLPKSVKNVVNKVISAYAKKQRYHKTMDELYKLDDNVLRDLGIARYEIPVFAHRSVYGN